MKIEYTTAGGGAFVGDGTQDGIVGFNYGTQMWVDTRATAYRDTSFDPGSASNPLRHVPLRHDTAGDRLLAELRRDRQTVERQERGSDYRSPCEQETS